MDHRPGGPGAAGLDKTVALLSVLLFPPVQLKSFDFLIFSSFLSQAWNINNMIDLRGERVASVRFYHHPIYEQPTTTQHRIFNVRWWGIKMTSSTWTWITSLVWGNILITWSPYYDNTLHSFFAPSYSLISSRTETIMRWFRSLFLGHCVEQIQSYKELKQRHKWCGGAALSYKWQNNVKLSSSIIHSKI